MSSHSFFHLVSYSSTSFFNLSFFVFSSLSDKKKLEDSLEKAMNKAIKRSQQYGAEEMKDVMGDMGLGGMPGM